MSEYVLRPEFIDGSDGRVFVLAYVPENVQQSVLFVPPFAEEMNKCRRQIAQTARKMAQQGCVAVVVDLFGTGDSDGEFADATWGCWKRDLVATAEWIADRFGGLSAVVGTRLGCPLACESLSEAGLTVNRTVFWQPVANGRQMMTQFLRLQVAAAMMESSATISTETVRAEIQAGGRVEVAGYEISAQLAGEIDAVDLGQSIARNLGNLLLLEIGRGAQPELSHAGKRLLSAAEEAGIAVAARRLPGEPIWAATEIVTNDRLGELTAAFVLRGETL